MIYLDNASTTQIDERVVEAIIPYLRENFGNAGSLHKLGISNKRALDRAKEQTAKFINAKPDQIVFTSGGTESNNMVLHNALINSTVNRKKIIVSSVEHDSILRPSAFLAEEFGLDIPFVGVDEYGQADLDALDSMIDESTVLVSVMMMNNEIGAMNDVRLIAKMCHNKGALFHCDATQAAGCIPIDVKEINCDFLTISGHKIHAPKGTGLLYVKKKKNFIPMILGGASQEFGLRGGTENVAGIVGFGKACEIEKELEGEQGYITRLKLSFWNELNKQMREIGLGDIIHDNAGSGISYGKVLSVRFDGVDAEALTLMLSSKDVYVSAGSACKSHEQEPSRVLTSIGLTPVQARSTIRISFSRMNTAQECAEAAKVIAETVKQLHEM